MIQTGANRITRPVIGVLVQPPEWYDKNGLKENYLPELENKNHVYTQSIRYLEAAGALIVPIHWDDEDLKIKSLMDKLNGVILPGGMVNIDLSHHNKGWSENKLTKTTELIINYAIKQNDEGRVLSILGICQGFQQLFYNMSGFQPVIQWVSGLWDTSNTIQITDRNCTTFLKTCLMIIQNIYKKLVAIHFYNNLGVFKSDYDKNYPIYATQFHLEVVYQYIYLKA